GPTTTSCAASGPARSPNARIETIAVRAYLATTRSAPARPARRLRRRSLPRSVPMIVLPFGTLHLIAHPALRAFVFPGNEEHLFPTQDLAAHEALVLPCTMLRGVGGEAGTHRALDRGAAQEGGGACVDPAVGGWEVRDEERVGALLGDLAGACERGEALDGVEEIGATAVGEELRGEAPIGDHHATVRTLVRAQVHVRGADAAGGGCECEDSDGREAPGSGPGANGAQGARAVRGAGPGLECVHGNRLRQSRHSVRTVWSTPSQSSRSP